MSLNGEPDEIDPLELVDRGLLVQLLKTKGPRDTEAAEMLARFAAELERSFDAAGRTDDAFVYIELTRAHLYFEAGGYNSMRNAFQDAYDLARKVGRTDLEALVCTTADECEARVPKKTK